MPFKGNSSYQKNHDFKELSKPTSYEQQVLHNIKTRQREGNAIPKQGKSEVNLFQTSQNQFYYKKEPLERLSL